MVIMKQNIHSLLLDDIFISTCVIWCCINIAMIQHLHITHIRYCKPDGFVLYEVVIVDDINNNSGLEMTKMDLVVNVRFERRFERRLIC